MTLVELDDVVDWLKKHLQEFTFESWNIPLDYSEEEELTKAICISLEGGDYKWDGYGIIKEEGDK